MSAVSGFEDLDRVFRELSKGMANRIARPGLAKAGRLVAKRVKAAIPSKYKEARKAVKSRSVKTRRNAGFASAKIGFHVGQKKNARGKQKERSKKKKGVGLGSANAHWFAAGTDHRWTGTKRVGAHRKGKKNKRVFTGGVVRYTGRMKPHWAGVDDIARRSKSEIAALLKANIETGIEKEAARLAKKRL